MKTFPSLVTLVAAASTSAVALFGCLGGDNSKPVKDEPAQVRPTPAPKPPQPSPEPRPIIPRPGPTDTGDPGPPKPPQAN